MSPELDASTFPDWIGLISPIGTGKDNGSGAGVTVRLRLRQAAPIFRVSRRVEPIATGGGVCGPAGELKRHAAPDLAV